MRVRRLGFNTMLYTIQEYEIPYLGLDKLCVSDVMQNEQNLQLITGAVMERLLLHIVPEMALVSMPLNVKVHQTSVTEMELFMQFINTQEVLDYAMDYDEIIDLEIDDVHKGHVRFANSTMEEILNENPYGKENDSFDDDIDDDACDDNELLILVFKKLDDVIHYIKATNFIPEKPESALYKFNNQYNLICDFKNVEDVMNIVR